MNFLKRYWFYILLIIIFSVFTFVDNSIMKRRIEEVKQENLNERIEHSLEWSRMLCDKQELIIDQLYERRIISMKTHRALQGRNELWLKQQMARKVKNGHK
ncbi:hypothetical protein KAU34_10630 [candidate division WOR-3 bacterium]|nr:hypothetical protein [candidate division WOR-3 bacterium]